MLGGPDPEHAEVGEDHQVEQGQLKEVREAEEMNMNTSDLSPWKALVYAFKKQNRLRGSFTISIACNGAARPTDLARRVGTETRRNMKRQPLLVY